MSWSRTIAATLTLALLAGGALSVAAADECFADWSVAAPIVKKEGLLSIEELTARGRGKLPGGIVKTLLCRQGGDFVYQLIVREPGGALRRILVDARKPW